MIPLFLKAKQICLGFSTPYCDRFYCCFTEVKVVKLYISITLISADIYIIFIKFEAYCIPVPSGSFLSLFLGGLHQHLIESVTAVTVAMVGPTASLLFHHLILYYTSTLHMISNFRLPVVSRDRPLVYDDLPKYLAVSLSQLADLFLGSKSLNIDCCQTFWQCKVMLCLPGCRAPHWLFCAQNSGALFTK